MNSISGRFFSGFILVFGAVFFLPVAFVTINGISPTMMHSMRGVPCMSDMYENRRKCWKLSELLHPWKQNMDPWKRRVLLETIISRFHVNFWGCSKVENLMWKRFDSEAVLFECETTINHHTFEELHCFKPWIAGKKPSNFVFLVSVAFYETSLQQVSMIMAQTTAEQMIIQTWMPHEKVGRENLP